MAKTKRVFSLSLPASRGNKVRKHIDVQQSVPDSSKLWIWISMFPNDKEQYAFVDLTPYQAKQIAMALIAIADRMEYGEGGTNG